MENDKCFSKNVMNLNVIENCKNMCKGKVIGTLFLVFLPLLGIAQSEPTIDLKSEESLLILIDSHAKIADINVIHKHVSRLERMMRDNRDITARLQKNFTTNKSNPIATQSIIDYCFGIKTEESMRFYELLKNFPQNDPDVILVEHFRQVVIKSAGLFGLTLEEYVISGKF